MTPLWSWPDLVAASGGAGDGTPSGPITGFSIDTRSIGQGEVFVALRDARDGHAFVPNAFAAGAAAALVETGYRRAAGDGALIRVADPLRALESIARAARARAKGATVIAITGSAGKTGTKEMLRACLAPLGRTHAPEKSFNNHWGVPLTLARMPADTRFAVIEIGMNHAGEITPLTRMTQPDIAIVTNVLPVHVGHFTDGEIGVANAKAEIFLGLAPGGTAIMLRDSQHFERLRAAASAARAKVVTFGTSADCDVRLQAANMLPDGGTAVRTNVAAFVLGTAGQHLTLNSLAIVAAMGALGIADIDAALRPLERMTPPAGRGQRTRLTISGGTALLVDESYNANPASMKAALETLALIPRAQCPRRVIVLGDMRELGEGAAAFHRGLKSAIDASGADLVFACGPHMREVYEMLPETKHGAWAMASTEVAAAVAAAIRPGDVVMIKGSLGTNMAPIVAAVRALARSSCP